VNVAEMIEAMRKIAPRAPERITFRIDPRVEKIVMGWPVRFDTPRALSMGFKADPGIEAVIRDYVAARKSRSARNAGELVEERQCSGLDALARRRARRRGRILEGAVRGEASAPVFLPIRTP